MLHTPRHLLIVIRRRREFQRSAKNKMVNILGTCLYGNCKKCIMKFLASLNGLQDLHGLLIFCILSEEKKKQENGS